MVIMFDFERVDDINEVIYCCPFKKTFKECNDLDKCSMYDDRIGCVAYDVKSLWG